MKPFETLETEETPGGQLTFHRHDGEYYIYLDGEELMSTRVASSESALGTLSCAELPPNSRPRVLIGGMGLGFSLRATLEALPTNSEVVVSELFPAVVEWNRKYLGERANARDARRLEIDLRDVRLVISSAPTESFHGILLDVDNGPSAWCIESNGALYERDGLTEIHRALAPAGILAVWSAYTDDAFVKRLGKAGFDVTKKPIRGHEGRGPRHTLFIGRKRTNRRKPRA